MKVKRLKMTAFRGISDLTLEFPTDESTVLIGVNGVGKSSILDCLAILLSQLTGIIQSSLEAIRSFSEQDITNGKQQTHNEITIFLDEREVNWSLTEDRKRVIKSREALQVLSKSLVEEILHQMPLIVSVPAQILIEQVKANKQWQDINRDNPALQVVVDELRTQLAENPETKLPLAVYYPVNRAVLEIPLEILEEHQFEQIDTYDRALTGGRIDFKSFFEWFRNREDVENEELRDNPEHRDHQLQAVRNAVYSVLDDKEKNFSNLRVRRSPLQMTITKLGQELIVNQLSDGEKCLLAMVGDLARRLAIANPSLSDPLQGSGVVLIDEIELHLHPKWQRKIIPALTRTFPNCQFIVTTHSPQVISEVKPDSIYILEKTDLGIIARRPESSYGRDTNRILEDLMDTPERPQEIKESLLELFRLIAKGELDSARQLHQKIADEIGADEPELVGASVSIRRREILGR
jgi:predicted ATP-binding protein involved in virulence